MSMSENEKMAERGLKKVAFVGGRTSTVGFRAIGLDTYTVDHPENAEKVWDRIQMDNYGIIFITEPIYDQLKERLKQRDIEGVKLPVVTVVPAISGSKRTGFREIKEMVEKAVGIDLFSD